MTGGPAFGADIGYPTVAAGGSPMLGGTSAIVAAVVMALVVERIIAAVHRCLDRRAERRDAELHGAERRAPEPDDAAADAEAGSAVETGTGVGTGSAVGAGSAVGTGTGADAEADAATTVHGEDSPA